MRKQSLATRMRPLSINDVVGQDHLIGYDENGQANILTRMVNAKQVTSIILYGPPGVGKTSIANALANDLNIMFGYFNAANSTKKELIDEMKKGKIDKPIVILIDEVHRLDKPKQDLLLEQIEEGSVIMVGATSENPYLNITKAMRSRSHIMELKPVHSDAIIKRLQLATEYKTKGLGDDSVIIEPDVLAYISQQSSGDLRFALNTLELAALSTPIETKENQTGRFVTIDIINKCIQKRQIENTGTGETHYNLLSAFQKSIRGSDVDASLHYLARLIESGDLLSIIRRLMVIAYEDISLAAPNIGVETVAATTVAERVGLPEARIPLAHITVRLALSSKSNVAYKGIDNATKALYDGRDLSIPKHLRDAHYDGAKDLGNGVNYEYPHDHLHGIVEQTYMPDEFKHDRYLTFRDVSDTANVNQTYQRINDFIKKTNHDTWDEKADQYAEKYGIMKYQVINNEMHYEEAYLNEGVYSVVVNLTTMTEKSRIQIK